MDLGPYTKDFKLYQGQNKPPTACGWDRHTVCLQPFPIGAVCMMDQWDQGGWSKSSYKATAGLSFRPGQWQRVDGHHPLAMV
jgi:hypothetical protein